MEAGSLLAVSTIVIDANIYNNIAATITSQYIGLFVEISLIVFPISMLERILISKKVMMGWYRLIPKLNFPSKK